MAGSLLNRIKQGLGLGEGSGGPLTRKVASHFSPLSKVKGSLPAEVAQYAAEGDNSSVLLTLQGQAAREQWRTQPRYYPKRDEAGLFRHLSDWRVDQLRRFGEAHAALEPISYD